MTSFLRRTVLIGIFLLPFLPLVVTNSLFFPFITGKNFAFRIIVEIIFVAWALLALYDVRYRPHLSGILLSLAAFVGVVFLANVFGENPYKSFWSNFERMDGFVMLFHVFLYVVVLMGVLKTRVFWMRLFNTTLFASAIVLGYAFLQLAGIIEIHQGGVRLDGPLGNAAYFASYLLFHVFLACFMLLRTKETVPRLLYGVLAVALAWLLIETATRGAMLGLVGGVLLTSLFILYFEKQWTTMRKFALGLLSLLVVCSSLFYVFRDASFIAQDPALTRIASISLEEGETRFTIWGLALRGVAENPLLGWGQGNFSFIFDAYYHPSLHSQEPWFDRVHNIVLDWLVAAGALGLLAYLSIWVFLVYRLLHSASRDKKDTKEWSLSVPERGVFFGLLGGYFFQNLFVFDQLISYVLFGIVLAFIHHSTTLPREHFSKWVLKKETVKTVVAPILCLVLLLVVYLVNVPSIRAAHALAKARGYESAALGSRIPQEQFLFLEESRRQFEQALGNGSFGNREVREHLLLASQNILRSPLISPEQKNSFVSLTDREVRKQLLATPRDARVRLLAASFYRDVNQLDEALKQLEIARSLTPQKQRILFEVGLIYLQQEKYDQALVIFKEAYDLEPQYSDARIFYAIAAMYNGEEELREALVSKEDEAYYLDDRILQAISNRGRINEVIRILNRRIEIFEERGESEAEILPLYISLAVMYYNAFNDTQAVSTLEEAAHRYPGFAPRAAEFILEIQSGSLPRE